MIHMADLRIGNFVMETLVSMKSKAIAFTREHYHYREDDYTPIDLTEEWLLRFGAMRKGLFYVIKLNQTTHLSFQKAVLDGHKVWDASIVQVNDEVNLINYPLEFVHELQNLFYALTATEIKVKQKTSA
jgi:hypothetical protein